MSAVRTQYVIQTTATIAAGPGVSTVVDIVRPESPAGVPYAENTDYVTEPRQDVQNESGMVVIEPSTAFAIAALLLTRVDVYQSYYPAQTGLGGPSSTFPYPTGVSGPMFPSGSTPPSNGVPTLVRTVFQSTAGLAMNSADIPAILGASAIASGPNPLTNPTFPGIELLSGQFVKLTVLNTAGAVGPSTFTAKYDLGVNAVEYRKL